MSALLHVVLMLCGKELWVSLHQGVGQRIATFSIPSANGSSLE